MSVEIKPNSIIEIDLGLEPYGKAHNFFANECISRMNENYTPFDNGGLVASSYVDEQCNIHYDAPYSRYMYYGKLMVMENGKGAYYSPDYGFWSKPGAKKFLTDRDLIYHKAGTGPYWDKLMVSAEKDEILSVMQDYVNKRGKK